MKGTSCLGLLLLLLPLGVARAWPVDNYVDLKPGEDRFQRFSSLAWVESGDPAVATADALPSGEMMMTGKAPGRTLFLLYAEGKFAVWRVRVWAQGAAPAAEAKDSALSLKAEKSCPGLKVREARGDSPLPVSVSTDACRLALRALFEADGFRARELELNFDVAVLQSQLRELSKAIEPIAPKVRASYLGAGLVLEGEVTEAQHHAILWQVFRRAVGRVALDDALHTPEPVSKEPEVP